MLIEETLNVLLFESAVTRSYSTEERRSIRYDLMGLNELTSTRRANESAGQHLRRVSLAIRVGHWDAALLRYEDRQVETPSGVDAGVGEGPQEERWRWRPATNIALKEEERQRRCV